MTSMRALLATALLLSTTLLAGPQTPVAPQTRPRTLVALLAHPDDESAASPVLARYAREGVNVHLIIASDGSAGSGTQTYLQRSDTAPAGDALAKARAEEARCAATALGVKEPVLLGFPDGKLGDYPGDRTLLLRLTERIAQQIALLRPDVVITWGPDGGTGHPDHRLVSNIATQLQRAGAPGMPERLFYMYLPVEAFRALNPQRGEPPMLIPQAKYFTVQVPFEPVDLEAAQKSAACHRSQFTPETLQKMLPELGRVWNGKVAFVPGSSALSGTDLFRSQPALSGVEGPALSGVEPAGQSQTGTTNPTAQTPLTAAPRRTEADARAAAERNRRERELQRQRTGAPVELISSYIKANILPVPASLGVSPFYTKYVDAQGIPVISSDKVPDDAVLVARDIINSMLAKRPDIRASMIKRRWRTGVIAEVEMTMDIPEYSRMKRPGAPRDEPVTQADRDYHANRSRGLGGNPTTGAEENLLGYPGTRYYGEHIFVHEFAHAIMSGVRDVDPKMHAEIGEAYKAAMAAGKYVHPGSEKRRHYATTNAGEYWAEGVQWWFFSNFGECFVNERGNIRVDTPEEFAAYDPTLNELISRVFDGHRIPMDVFHAKQVRKVTCGVGSGGR